MKCACCSGEIGIVNPCSKSVISVYVGMGNYVYVCLKCSKLPFDQVWQAVEKTQNVYLPDGRLVSEAMEKANRP